MIGSTSNDKNVDTENFSGFIQNCLQMKLFQRLQIHLWYDIYYNELIFNKGAQNGGIQIKIFKKHKLEN
ncbi:unnamed protein product [Paramecium sonneborni]|uniref:Uncharacterized protein n=1 Tax=Paramecium sonneborni TaxID=65129 RepID=A0A8S1PWJ5_9CILI|nr:unnamed protein product [Paramecium sonneborni]